jgi:hypothetical protein
MPELYLTHAEPREPGLAHVVNSYVAWSLPHSPPFRRLFTGKLATYVDVIASLRSPTVDIVALRSR